MKKFNLKIEGETIPIRVVFCEVMSVQTLNETNIYSEKNYDKTVNVHSKSIEYIKFWVKTDDGIEDEFKLPASWIKLREGHRLSLMFDEKTTGAIAIFNQNLKTSYVQPNLIKFYKLEKKDNYFWLKFIGLSLSGIFLSSLSQTPLGLIVLYPIYRLYQTKKSFDKENARLNQIYTTTVSDIIHKNLG